MNKQETLSFIQEELSKKNISKDDLLNIVNKNRDSQGESNKLINVLYTIGAIIAVTGISILIGQNWNDIGMFGRLITTLGIFLATYITAFILQKPEQKILSQVMFSVSAILAPVSAWALLQESNIDFSIKYQTITALLLTIIFATALFVTRKHILVLITLVFATWGYFTEILHIFDISNYYGDFYDDVLKWWVILLGIAYMFIAYGYQSILKPDESPEVKEKNIIQGIIYNLGALGVLIGGISVGGVFDALFVAIIFAVFYIGVYLRSNMMLLLGAIFLVSHIIKITSKYFVDTIGWSVSLILIGFIIIGVSYGTFYISKKYIGKKG